MVCKLNKALYGLKQAPRYWNNMLHDWLAEQGLKQADSDPCLYTRHDLWITIWVDDLLIAGKNKANIDQFKRIISTKFKMKDLGPVSWCLGMKITRDRLKKTLTISQPQYVNEILSRFNMSNCKPAATPLVPKSTLKRATTTDEPTKAPYGELVGCLLYLSTRTRPDIAAAVGTLTRYTSQPCDTHWVAAKHVLRYLRGSPDIGLTYGAATNNPAQLHGYADASFADDVDTRRSTSGCCLMLNGAAVAWRSKLQPTTAVSTAEAEYVALCRAAQEAIHLRQLLEELGVSQGSAPTTIFEDNQPCLHIANNPFVGEATKHMAVKYHYVRDMIQAHEIKVEYCPTSAMLADCLTKNLPRETFRSLTMAVMGTPTR